ncbi:hypothetical protein [Larkinella rosea]|uniref:hypothetical protein n=1 Tax=Larkinella rosea TaxID=2025312 RepID=UPI001E530E2D|nr:hypothetical protein [Larkinella rosea]
MITADTPEQVIKTARSPAQRLSTYLLVGLSLSIGWGIRGNFGHEYGAAFAGCLAAITVALMSGREDWRQRVLYFAFFGAIGWGFGASISYMQVISYTQSGHVLSQWYGYTGLFYIGFLWAGLGGAGTALAAVAEQDRLVRLFKPILFVFAAWFFQDLIEDAVAKALQSGLGFDRTWSRHKSPLYWFDADYLGASFALLGVGIYDLQERRQINGWLLPVFAGTGAVLGYLSQWMLQKSGLEAGLSSMLTYQLGDPSYVDPATGKTAFDPHNFLNNWPQWFGDYPQHVGWVIGLVLGITAYFIRFGKFRNGSSLIVYMASGWLLAFLAFPVLGSLFFADVGGIRMTPPRSDDWAGITGVFVGTVLWMRRNQLLPVAVAAVMSGTMGGLGFSGVQCLKHLLMAPGNPTILKNKGVLPESESFLQITTNWANWQHQNWHSFLEQSYGFVNGIAIAVTLAFLATRIPIQTNPKPADPNRGRWTLGVAAVFVLLAIPYVNLVKNVEEWGKKLNPAVWTQAVAEADGSVKTAPAVWDVPYLGHLPKVDYLHLSPDGWFNLTWFFLLVMAVLVVRRHLQEPLAIIPKTWLGKGQLLFLILLWVMVIGNFERALVDWAPQRLLTEWVITINAVLATALVVLAPFEKETVRILPENAFALWYNRVWIRAIAALVLAAPVFLVTNRLVYQYPPYEKLDKVANHTRFGPEASWRARPNLKNAEHK